MAKLRKIFDLKQEKLQEKTIKLPSNKQPLLAA